MSKGVKCRLGIAAILALLPACMSVACVQAATARATVTINVTILPRSQLTLTDTSNAKGAVGATASAQTGSAPAILTVAASSDLMTRSDIDAIAGVTAAGTDASGKVFLAAPATRSVTAPGAAGGEGCSASYSEAFNWYLAKSWSCSPGKNTVTVTYTLTSP